MNTKVKTISTTFFVLLGLLFLTIRCAEDDTDIIKPAVNGEAALQQTSVATDQVLPLNAEDQKLLENGQKRLRELADLVPALQTPHVRQTVYDGIRERVDEDNNILWSDLLTRHVNQSNVTVQSFLLSNGRAEKQLADMTSPIEGFDEIFHDPQIFIPFFEDLEAAGIIGTQPPIIVIHTVENETGEYPGYEIENGALVQLPYLISEEIAMNNEVWVVSVNESTPENDEDLSGSRTEAGFTVNFEQIRIDNLKEDWINGASEVHVLEWLDNGTLNSPDARIYKNSGHDAPQGRFLREIKRKYKGVWRGLHYSFVIDWDDEPDYCYYVLFEYDAWPAQKRVASFNPPLGGTQVLAMEYRSTHTFWDSRSLFRLNATAGSPYSSNSAEYTMVSP